MAKERLPALRRLAGLLALLAVLPLAGCAAFFAPPATPTPAASATATLTPTVTHSPTPTATSTPTATPSPTPTVTPVIAGTAYPQPPEVLQEINLERAAELARWGRGQVRDFAWSGDKLFAATDLGVYVYDAATLTLLALLDAGPVQRLAPGPGNTLITVGAGWTRWRLHADGTAAGREALPAAGSALALGVDAAGNLAFITQAEGRAAEIHPAGGAGAFPLAGQAAPLSGAVFSADLSLAAGWDALGNYAVWQSDGSKLLDLPPADQARGPLVFSPDNTVVAVALLDNSFDYANTNRIRFYALPSGAEFPDLAAVAEPEGRYAHILSLAYSADGERIAAGYANGAAAVWRTVAGHNGSAPEEHFLAGLGKPLRLAFSPDGLRLASGGIDLWDVQTGKLFASVPEHRPPAADLALSPDGSLVALAGFGQVELRRVADGRVERVIQGAGLTVNALAFSPDGTLLAGACADGTARLWRVRDGRFLTQMIEPGLPQWSVAYAPDGQQILIGGEDGLIQRYEIAWDNVTATFREPYLAGKLVYSPVGLLFGVLTSAGAEIRDIEGELTRQISGVGLEDMAFSPDGGALALAGRELLQVIDVGTGRDLYAQYDPNRAAPTALAYANNGAFLAVGRADGSIDILWAGDGVLLRTLTGHQGRVRGLAFTSGAGLLLSTGEDGTVRVWGITK